MCLLKGNSDICLPVLQVIVRGAVLYTRLYQVCHIFIRSKEKTKLGPENRPCLFLIVFVHAFLYQLILGVVFCSKTSTGCVTLVLIVNDLT